MAQADDDPDPPADGPDFEVPLALLDEALGLPLTPQYVDRIEPDLALCERLYFALKPYHLANRLGPMDRKRLRPNLSFVGLGGGVLVNTDFDGYRAGSFIPRNGELVLPDEETLKSTLVFADALVVEDPVFAFCRSALCHRFQEARPAFGLLKESLERLAAMRRLIEMRLVRLVAYFPPVVGDVAARVPRSGGGLRVGDVTAATEHADPAVLALLGAPLPADEAQDPQALRRRATALQQQHGERFRWLYRHAESVVYTRQLEGAYAPFMPNAYQRDIFGELLRMNRRTGPSDALWRLSELNSQCAVDPERVGWDELADIRLSDAVFALWRDLVRRATEAATQDGALDAQAFRLQMHEFQEEWNDEQRRYRGERVPDLLQLGKQVSLGTVGGLLKTIVGGTPSIEALWNVLRGPLPAVHDELLRRDAERALAGFFAYVGPIRPPGPYDW